MTVAAAQMGVARLVPPMQHRSAPSYQRNVPMSMFAATSGSARPVQLLDGYTSSPLIPTCHDGRASPLSQPPPEPLEPVSDDQLPEPSMFSCVPPTATTYGLSAGRERPTDAPLSPVEK